MLIRLARPLLLMLALNLAAGAGAADPLSDTVSALDPLVSDVRVAGNWHRDGKPGLYRVLLARTAVDHPAARIYVQSLGIGTDGVPSVFWTIEINEFADLKVDVASFNAEVEQGGLTVFIEIANPAGDAPASYELIVEDDGTYRFGPSSN